MSLDIEEAERVFDELGTSEELLDAFDARQAAQDVSSSPAPSMHTAPRLHGSWRRFVTAALVLAGFFLTYRPGQRIYAAELELRIRAGQIRCDCRDGVVVGSKGQVILLNLGVGDRLTSASDAETVLELVGFGELRFEPGSRLEMLELEISEMKGMAYIAAISFGVLSGTVTHYVLGATQSVSAGRTLELKPGGSSGDASMPSPQEFEEALQKIKNLEQQIVELNTAQDVRRIQSEEPVKKTDPKAPEEKPAARFSNSDFAEALAKVDWKLVGESIYGMTPALQALADGNVPGTGLNGKFTHPMVAANQLHYALQAAGIALSEDQQRRLDSLAKNYSTEDEIQRLTSSRDEIRLAGLIAEAEVKGRFFNDAENLLSAEQHAVMFSDRTKGRLHAEVYGESVLWAGFAKPVRVSGPADLSKQFMSRYIGSLSLPESEMGKVKTLVDEWARSYPPSYWQEKVGKLSSRGRIKVSRIRLAAKRQLALIRKITRNVKLSKEQKADLYKRLQVFVPMPK